MSARDWLSFARSLFDPTPDTTEYQALVARFAVIDAEVALFADELDALDGPNPLFVGFACDVCGARLDKSDRPCPLGPHERPTA